MKALKLGLGKAGLRLTIVLVCLCAVMTGLCVSVALAQAGRGDDSDRGPDSDSVLPQQGADSVMAVPAAQSRSDRSAPPANRFDDCMDQYCRPAYDGCAGALCEPLVSGCAGPCISIYTADPSACVGACRDLQDDRECVEPHMGAFLACAAGCWDSDRAAACGYDCLADLEESRDACEQSGRATPSPTAPPTEPPIPAPTFTPRLVPSPSATGTSMPTATPQPLCTTVALEVMDLNGAGMPYSGVAADGVSELHFQACFPEGSTGRSVGCRNLGTGDTVECQHEIVCSGEKSHVVSCDALDGAGDTTLVTFKPTEPFTRPYTLELVAGVGGPQAQQAMQQVSVVRPPVVLIHGIWANAGSVTPIKAFLESTAQFAVVETVDYGAAPDDMRLAVPLLRTRVEDALNQMNTLRAAKVARVDIVAHSMGGLISRLYMQGYNDPYGQQVPGQGAKVRKLITLDTPHTGSPLADWYSTFAPSLTTQSDPSKEELDWVISRVRQSRGMSPPALEYGEAVSQLRTDSLLLRELGASLATPDIKHVQYYAVAGDRPFIVAQQWVRDFATGVISATYPYSPGHPGPNGQTSQSPRVQAMIRDFVNGVSQPGTDGVVPLGSSLGRGTGIAFTDSMTVTENHFSVKANGTVHNRVLQWLTDDPSQNLSGTATTTHSPGHLHVYDADGGHVGQDQSGQPEIGIGGALYEPYSDETGLHEFIWVPTVEGVEVRFVADEEGIVGLDISQGYDDGLHSFSYQEIQVVPGSEIKIELDPTNPSGQLLHPDGETIDLSPTYTEVPSPVVPTPTPEGEGASPVGCCGSLYSAAGLAVVGAVICARRRPHARSLFTSLLLVGAALMLLSCLPTATGLPEASVTSMLTPEPVQSATQPTATPVQATTQTALSADEIMERSAEVMERLTSAHIAFSQESPGSYTATGSGYVLMPDRAHFERLSSIEEGSVETIIIGATGYWRPDPEGDWTLGPSAPFASNPASWIPLSQFYADPTRLADENVGGVDCYHLRFAVEFPSGWCGLFNGGGTGEVWIAKDGYFVAQAAYELEYQGSREGGQMNLTFALSQFNEPVTIEAPE